MEITIYDIINLLDKYRQKYKHTRGENTIRHLYDNGDYTIIGIGDDGKSIYVSGRIIGDLDDFKDWITR